MSRYMGKEYNREFIYIMEKRNFGTSRKKGGKGKFGVFGKWKKGVSESAPDPPMPDSRIRGSTVRWFRTVALLPGNPAPRFHTNQDSRLQQNSETGIPGVRGSRLPGFPATAKPGVRGSRDQTSAPECRFLRVGWPFPGLLHPGRVIVPDDPLKALLGPFPTLRANTLIQNTRFPCWVTT